MGKKGRISLAVICVCILCWSVMPVSAVSSTVIGDTVHLSGKGGGYDDMYLFLTGPNLAPCGVKPDSVSSPVVSGNAASFIRAPVRNGVWEYEWDTGRTGGTLDPGTYLIWAVGQPLNRCDLRGASYATISILLKDPTLNAEISGTVGSDDSGVTADDTVLPTAQDTGDASSNDTVDDGDAGSDVSDEPPDVSGDIIPLSTTAGSFPCSWLCAAFGAVLSLLCAGRK